MKRLMLFFLCSLLFSCSEKQRAGGDYNFPQSYTLNGKLYSTDIIASTPNLFIASDSLAIAIDSPANKDFIRLYSIPENFREIGRYGMKGRGPLEFISPGITTVDGNNIFLYNLNMREVVNLEISDAGDTITEKSRFSYENHPKTDLMLEPNDPVHLSSGYYAAASHNNSPEFFSLWDDSLHFIRFFGDAPIQEKVELLQSANFLQGRMRAYGDKFVFSCSDLPYIAMYEIKDGEPIQKWAKYYQEPFYEVENEGILFYRDKTFGMARGLAVGKNYVYVLFLDILNSQYDAKSSESSKGNIIFVFDHDGNNTAKLELDHRLNASSIAVSPDEKKLYGVAVTPEYQFVEYDLPDFKN